MSQQEVVQASDRRYVATNMRLVEDDKGNQVPQCTLRLLDWTPASMESSKPCACERCAAIRKSVTARRTKHAMSVSA